MFPVRKNEVAGKFRERLRRQEYKPSRIIDGVKLIDFDFHADDGGDFYEIARITSGVVSSLGSFGLKQINRSRFNPGQ